MLLNLLFGHIAQEDIPKLYSAFERINEERNKYIEGTGLGMSITTQLLELMGSKLEVESTLGVGSVFSFTLYQGVSDQTPIGDFRDGNRTETVNYQYKTGFIAPDAKVLVVDDNAINLRVFKSLIKQTKIHIFMVDSGKKCLDIIQKQKFDIIFLDHMMPEMDGIDVLHAIASRTDHLCKDVPVVMLTANATNGARELYIREGASDYLSKPIVPDLLDKMLLKYLPAALVKEPE